MKRLIGLNLDIEIIEELKKKSNMSGFVNQVLKEALAIEQPITERLEMQRKIAEDAVQELNEIEIAASELTEKQEKAKKEQEEKENKEWELQKEQREAIRKSIQLEAFNNYDVEPDFHDELFLEYWTKLENGVITNLKDFMKEKGFEKKEKFFINGMN